MINEYLRPMLDIGSPRVLNCNVMTRQILEKDPEAKTFFRCKPLNNLVLIKDRDPQSTASAIGTKLYLPFNEADVYEGGRTIFVHARGVEEALINNFGTGAVPKELLSEDMRILKILDKLPSLDPFLLKDVFINEKIEMNPSYFDVNKELWNKIEAYILEGFESLAKAAFPEALSSDEVARKIVEKIWEGRDLEALKPLIIAFRLPAGQELEIFAAWKGINFYGYEHRRSTPLMDEFFAWLKTVQIPVAVVSGAERKEIQATLENVKIRINEEWQTVENILRHYKNSYDKMFKQHSGSGDFLNFLQNSSKAYWTLGNSLGKTGQAVHCWDAMTKRHPNRKLPWDQLREIISLLSKIFSVDQKLKTAVSWT